LERERLKEIVGRSRCPQKCLEKCRIRSAQLFGKERATMEESKQGKEEKGLVTGI
jgi:hypothetical protein